MAATRIIELQKQGRARKTICADDVRACGSAGPFFCAIYCAVMSEDVYAGERDPRRTEAFCRALEYASKSVALQISEYESGSAYSTNAVRPSNSDRRLPHPGSHVS